MRPRMGAGSKRLGESRVAELTRVGPGDRIEADGGVPVEERLELAVVEPRCQAPDPLPESVEAHQAGVVDGARPQRLR
jgi:hypothetical protein